MELRTITAEEYPEWIRMVDAQFGSRVSDEEAAVTLTVAELDRFVGVYDEGRPVAGAGMYTFDLTLPGGATVPVGGVTNVSVRPTHRRRGLASQLLGWLHDQSRERGEAAGILDAAEAVIYERFGYGPTGRWALVEVDCRRVLPLRDVSEVGTFELHEGDVEERTDLLQGIFDRARLLRHGQVSRPRAYTRNFVAENLTDTSGGPRQVVIHRDGDGEPVGYAAYRYHDDPPPYEPSKARVIDLVAVDPLARLRLHRYLASLDLVDVLEYRVFDSADPLRWAAADMRAVRTMWDYDWPWVAPIDIVRLLSARTYESDGSIVLAVTAPSAGDTGTFALTVEGGAGMCGPSDAAPDVTLPGSSLGSILLGGVSVSTLAAAGRASGPAGALAAADRLFRTTDPPYCQTGF